MFVEYIKFIFNILIFNFIMTIFFKNTKYFNTHTWKEEDKLKLYSENFQILSNFPPPSPYPRKTKPNLANQLFIVLWLCINITIYFLLWVLLGQYVDFWAHQRLWKKQLSPSTDLPNANFVIQNIEIFLQVEPWVSVEGPALGRYIPSLPLRANDSKIH